jgi:hypothetical protein
LKGLSAIGLLAGLAVLMLLVLSYGAGAIWHSATLLGLPGLGLIVAIHFVLIVFMGTTNYPLA